MTRPGDVRAPFVAEQCSDDPEVHAEVERLLAQPTAAGPSVDAVRGTVTELLDGGATEGRVVSHYRLEECIGAGGMGEVYRATDLALGRTAAVKVLGARLVGPYRKRLLLEAKMSARLQHPGIATFFEGGEDDGVAFLAMEYVRGETLRSRLRRGPLEVETALRIAAALLEALAHAHACEVVHRDIKPENIMQREDGAIKLLDFGIAKRVDTAELIPGVAGLAIDAEGSEVDTTVLTDGTTEFGVNADSTTIDESRSVLAGLTRRGSVIGTMGYMPPEQLRGEEIDARVDLFAVGAVLYEAIEGRPAFPGKTAPQRIAATLSGAIDPVSVPGANPQIDVVLGRALAGDRSRRYSSAGEFLRDLQALVSGEAVAIMPDTLAILAFDSRAGEQDDWIGGALSDSLAADLVRVEGLGVLPREKVARARAIQKDGDPVRIGLALGCRWILDGMVQRTGSSIRIVHRLLEVATGNVAHTGKTDGTYDDLFRLQDRVAAAVVEHLHVTMPESTLRRSAEHDLDAHECYNRGRALLLSLDRGRLDEAETWLTRAIEIEARHADALAHLAMLHAPSRWVVNTDPEELTLAVDFARRAIDIDARHVDAHVWLGYASWRQGRIQQALEAFGRALEEVPRHLWAHYFTASAATEAGDFDRAVVHARQAISSDAPTAFQYTMLGWSLQSRGDLAEALWALEKAAELEAQGGPMSPLGTLTDVADCLLCMGRVEEARRKGMESLEIIEASDHTIRDTRRTTTLCTLSRIAAEHGDVGAARAASNQCVAHLRGRPRGSGLGFTMVSALAVLARIDRDMEIYEEALGLYLGREGYDFQMAGLGAFQSRDALVSTAELLGRSEDIEAICAAATTRST